MATATAHTKPKREARHAAAGVRERIHAVQRMLRRRNRRHPQSGFGKCQGQPRGRGPVNRRGNEHVDSGRIAHLF